MKKTEAPCYFCSYKKSSKDVCEVYLHGIPKKVYFKGCKKWKGPIMDDKEMIEAIERRSRLTRKLT